MEYDSTAKADRAKAEAEDFCATCQKTIWMSFYFDAFGHNEKHDNENVTNITKLWRASKIEEPKGIFSFYYPGLGTPYTPELDLLAIAAWEYERELKNAKDTAKEKITSPNAAKDFGKTVAEKTLENDLSGSSKGWWANIKKAYKDTLNESVKPIQKWIDIIFKPQARQRWLKGIQREWVNFVEDLAHHPQRAIKTVYSALGKATIGKALEEVTWIRDNKWVATLFNVGIDTRFRAAEADFKTSVIKTLHNAKDIKHINIAVFGADMGGALAISFVNQLMQTICSGGQYEGIKVNIKFIGLFDCVSARYDDNFATGFIPLSNGVGGDLKIPKAAQKVVHYAAAHEQRWYKPLSTIDGKREFGARLEERLFPGAQEDVTGGYGDNEEGASNQLSRMPLQMMLGRAWRFGVPIIPLSKMETQFPALHEQFKMDEHIRTLVFAYWRKALELASTTTEIKVGYDSLGLDTRSQSEKELDSAIVSKLNIQTCAIPRIEKRTTLPADIKSEISGHVALYIGWLKHCCDATNKQQQRGKVMKAGSPKEVRISRNISFQELQDEIERLEKRYDINPLSPDSLTPDQKKYLDIWRSYSNSNILGDTAQLFDQYVHDSLSNRAILKVTDDFISTFNYLSVRRMNPLGQEEEKGVFERWFSIEKAKNSDAQKKDTLNVFAL